MALVDYFLKINGIDGESADDKHKGEIDIASWHWGAEQQGTSQQGGGGGAGKVKAYDFEFTAKHSKASGKLFLACANGQHFTDATLTCRKAGKDQQEFLKIKLSEVLISSYHTGGSGASDILPMDNVRMNFAKMETEYKEQQADGTLGGAIKAGYHFKQNKAI